MARDNTKLVGTNGAQRNSDKNLARRTFLKAGLAGAGSAVLAGCSGGGGTGGDGPFKIGMTVPLIQGWEPLGRGLERAAKLRVKEINNNGGLNNQEIEVIVRDTQVDPTTTAEVARELINKDEVDFLYGPISSANRNALGPLLSETETPLVYPVFYEGAAGNDYCHEWIFKTGAVPRQQIEPFIPYLIDEYGSNFYLIGADYIWPQATNEIIKNTVAEEGGTVLNEQYVPLDQDDFTSIIPSIQEENPDVLLMTLTGVGVISMQSQMAEQGVRDEWQDVQLACDQGLLSGMSNNAVEGLLTSHPYLELLDNKMNNEFISNFHDEYGEDTLVNYSSGPAYAGVQFIEAAANSARSTDVDDIVTEMTNVEVDTPLGEGLGMSVDHQLGSPAHVAEVQEDLKWHPIKQLRNVELENQCSEI